MEFGLKLRSFYMAIHEGLTTLYYRAIHESSFSLFYTKDTEISDEVILDIRKYKRILEDTVKRLWNCRFTQLHHEQFQIKSNYHFDKTYELFEIKNVELFKKIKKNLSNGKENKGTMEIINKILNGIFRMSNHCVTKYQSVLRYNPSAMIKNELIDIGSQDIEIILDQGLPKGRKRFIRELVDEL